MKHCDAQKRMLREIQKRSFMAVDIQLFLDTHPDCIKAREALKCATTSYAELKAEYESKYGALTLYGVSPDCEYDWTDEPWPWEREA